MAVYYVAYSNVADTFASSGTNATYATIRANTQSTAANVAATAGQVRNEFTSPNYLQAQSFLVFDTSAIPAGGNAGIFSINVTSPVNANADTLRFRQVSTVANKIAGGSLGALTLHSDPGTFPAVAGRYSSAIIDVAAIPRTATFNVVVHTAGQESTTGPTGISQANHNLADSTGTGNDPYLLITFGAPWAFVGVSNVVEVTATPHALVTTGIAGTLQAGDLLVACISSRIASTTSITLPTGGEWTLVSEQKNNNVLATTSAAASGLMAYCVRGASNPNLTFTHPVAPSVAMGRIIAYRNVNQSSPKDTQTSFTTAINTLAVSGAGLTTSEGDELLVAMACGGQEATWLTFRATDPNGFSDSTSTATPSPSTWQRRAETVTTTGVDTSLAIYDAVKVTAGATGNLTANASLGASHVVIAGAFKIAAAAPAPVTGTGTPAAQASDTDGLGTSSSEGSGTPASQPSAVSGLGTVAVPGVTGSGAVIAQASDVDGNGVSAWIGSGAPIAQTSAASGVGVSVSSGSGAVETDAAAVAGAGNVSTAEATGTGALAAQAATVAGSGAVASIGTGAVVADAAAVGGAGVSSSVGTGNAVADLATVAGIGSAAAANTGALVAQDAAVAGDGVASSDGVGALAANAASIAGVGLAVSTGAGELACSPITVAGVGVVLEEGVAVGTGELLAGAATISGEGEVTGEVAVPPVYGGYHYRPDRRPLPVEGHGYGILPQIEGEAHGVVAAVGRSIGTLPHLAGIADAAAGAAGSSTAHLTVKAAALGNAVNLGRGFGMIVKFEAAAAGRHDDDEAAVMAWLLAA